MTSGVGTQVGPYGLSALGTVSGAVDFDGSKGNVVSLTANGNISLTPKNLKIGAPYVLQFTQDAVGSRSLNLVNATLVGRGFTVDNTPASTSTFVFMCVGVNPSNGNPTILRTEAAYEGSFSAKNITAESLTATTFVTSPIVNTAAIGLSADGANEGLCSAEDENVRIAPGSNTAGAGESMNTRFIFGPLGAYAPDVSGGIDVLAGNADTQCVQAYATGAVGAPDVITAFLCDLYKPLTLQGIAAGADITLRTNNNADIYIEADSASSIFRVRVNTAGRIEADSTGLGFFGVAPVARPDVTGAKGGNAALTSLLTQLAALGLITDSTT